MTNDRAGTVGVGLTTGFLEPAHGVVAHQIGAQLPAHTPAALSPRTIRALLSDPVDVTAPPYRPLPPHSALALSAFCIAMLALTCGFLVDAIVQSGVDSAIETFMNTEPHFSTRGLADHLCNEATFVEWEHFRAPGLADQLASPGGRRSISHAHPRIGRKRDSSLPRSCRATAQHGLIRRFWLRQKPTATYSRMSWTHRKTESAHLPRHAHSATCLNPPWESEGLGPLGVGLGAIARLRARLRAFPHERIMSSMAIEGRFTGHARWTGTQGEKPGKSG
jgi:hypothetical protein